LTDQREIFWVRIQKISKPGEPVTFYPAIVMEQSEEWLSGDWNPEMQVPVDEPDCSTTLANLDFMAMSLY
jgi:hypothetical protein